MTFAVRGVDEFERGALKANEVRRLLTSLCRAALDKDDRVVHAAPSVKGGLAWLDAFNR